MNRSFRTMRHLPGSLYVPDAGLRVYIYIYIYTHICIFIHTHTYVYSIHIEFGGYGEYLSRAGYPREHQRQEQPGA